MVSENIELIVTTFAAFISIIALIIAYFSYKLAINQNINEVVDLFEKFVESCNAVSKFGSIENKKFKSTVERDLFMESKEDAVFLMLRRLDLIYGNKDMKQNLKYYINFNVFLRDGWEVVYITLFNNRGSDYFSKHFKYMKKKDVENLKDIVLELKKKKIKKI